MLFILSYYGAKVVINEKGEKSKKPVAKKGF
jgi:hypothetical protein